MAWAIAQGDETLRAGIRIGSPFLEEGSVKLIYRDREWELQGRMTVRQAIEKVGLIPETVLAVRDGKLLTEDTMLEPEDTVKLVSVVSGG